jgi:hypothetical protein
MSDVANPKITPKAIDTLNESKKIPIPWNIEDKYISVPWNWLSVLWVIVQIVDMTKNGQIYSLVHDDTNSIVKQTLSEDNCVELGINLVLIEDGEDGYRVCGR